ncbi:hypothetical protein GDO81_023761 [Engystomops pustulosus]|uniref:Uncharacterized protein n=1 Tax=Engystomops pustulosus TaxID=76066 RepID=A0AAV6YLL0_ENGPU|nr:hypothetical protein GDO81_023761 [Engystomops pustulosus]
MILSSLTWCLVRLPWTFRIQVLFGCFVLKKKKKSIKFFALEHRDYHYGIGGIVITLSPSIRYSLQSPALVVEAYKSCSLRSSVPLVSDHPSSWD